MCVRVGRECEKLRKRERIRFSERERNRRVEEREKRMLEARLCKNEERERDELKM